MKRTKDPIATNLLRMLNFLEYNFLIGGSIARQDINIRIPHMKFAEITLKDTNIPRIDDNQEKVGVLMKERIFLKRALVFES